MPSPPHAIDRPLVLGCALALLLGLFAVDARSESPAPPTPSPGKVVWFAIDGASRRVIDPLIEAGELPHLASLRARGCHGELLSLEKSLSPRIWTSQATGASPDEHGILGFVQPGSERHLYTSREVKLPRVWEIASQAGVAVGITNFWFTYPALQVRGYLLSDHLVPWRSDRMRQAFTGGEEPLPSELALLHPATLAPVIQRIIDESPAGVRDLEPIDTQSRNKVIETLMTEDRLAFELARAAEAHSPSRFQVIYTKGIDGVSHYFWEFHEADWPGYFPRPKKEDIALFRDAVANAYKHYDALLGEMLSGRSEDDFVLITSDHGFEAIPRRKGKFITGSHGNPDSRHGLYIVAGGPVVKDSCPEHVSLYDVTPTLLHVLGLPVSKVMRGQVVEAFFSKSWMQTHPVRQIRAYELPSYESDIDEVVDEEQRIEWLKTLGYIE